MKGPPLPEPRHATLQLSLAEAARSATGITFVARDESELFVPYRDVHARARGVAGALEALGVAPGDRVAVVFPTSPGFLDAFFGTLLAGAVPVPLYPPVRLGRLAEYHASTARMIAACGARLVLADGRTRSLLGQAVAAARPPLGCLDLDTLTAGSPRELELHGSPDDLGLVQYSSGSTTDPKPVALTQRNLAAQVAAIVSLLPAGGPVEQKGVSWLPLYHDMGLIGCLLVAVAHPAPLVLIPPEAFLARPALWLRALARHRGTVSVAPSFAYALAARRVRDEELEGHDLSAWRLALCGAEPVSLEALDRFSRRFAPIGFDSNVLLPVYGLAEASLAVTFAPPGRSPRTAHVDPARLAATGEAVPGPRPIASVGTPVPGTEVEVRGEDGRELPELRVGRIHVRGASVMSGYLGQPEETARSLVDGWLDTGDLGFVAGGELHVSGRVKNVIVIRGANHTPQEFEECLTGLAEVRAGCAAAVGFVPEGEDGEQLLVLAERSRESGAGGDDDSAAARIATAILARTGIRPHTVRLLAPGTLPRTSSGKLRRNEALRRFLAGELDAPAEPGRLGLLVEVVKSRLALSRLDRDR